MLNATHMYDRMITIKSRQFITDLKYAPFIATICRDEAFVRPSVCDAALAYLESFFDGVVHDEEQEENFTTENEIVHDVDVANQLHRTELRRSDHATHSRKLKQQPARTSTRGGTV